MLKTHCKVNIAPCCCVQQTSSEISDENVAKLSEYGVKRRGLTAMTIPLDLWRYYIATISKFTLVWTGLSGADKVNRVGLGVALLDGRRLHFGVSGRGVSVFWDLSLIFPFSGVPLDVQKRAHGSSVVLKTVLFTILVLRFTLLSRPVSSFRFPWRPAPSLLWLVDPKPDLKFTNRTFNGNWRQPIRCRIGRALAAGTTERNRALVCTSSFFSNGFVF